MNKIHPDDSNYNSQLMSRTLIPQILIDTNIVG